MRRLISSKRYAEPLSLGQHGDGSVSMEGNSTRFGPSALDAICQSQWNSVRIEGVFLKSLAWLFIVWAFSPGHRHILNSSEVASVPYLQ